MIYNLLYFNAYCCVRFDDQKIAAGQYIGVDPLLSKTVVRPVLARVLPPSIPGHESPPASGTERGSLCEALHVSSSRSGRGGG